MDTRIESCPRYRFYRTDVEQAIDKTLVPMIPSSLELLLLGVKVSRKQYFSQKLKVPQPTSIRVESKNQRRLPVLISI